MRCARDAALMITQYLYMRAMVVQRAKRVRDGYSFFFSMLTSEFLINIRDRAAIEMILKVKFDLLFIYTYTHTYLQITTNKCVAFFIFPNFICDCKISFGSSCFVLYTRLFFCTRSVNYKFMYIFLQNVFF